MKFFSLSRSIKWNILRKGLNRENIWVIYVYKFQNICSKETFFFQLTLGVLLAVSSAARLDSTYLPPGASGAGGGPGLPPPFRGGGGGAGGGSGGGGGGGTRGFGNSY